MAYHKGHRKFGRVAKQRDALLRSLARSLILNGKIRTTEAKAKELRPYVEKLVTKGKSDTLATRRLIASRLGNEKKVTSKVIDDLSTKYKERSGGYTRIIKLSPRKSDAAPMAQIEFV